MTLKRIVVRSVTVVVKNMKDRVLGYQRVCVECRVEAYDKISYNAIKIFWLRESPGNCLNHGLYFRCYLARTIKFFLVL